MIPHRAGEAGSHANNIWNDMGNWVGNTVPNGSGDTATFSMTTTVNPTPAINIEVNGIVFTPNADAYTITINPNLGLTSSGVGITNNSVFVQNFVIWDRLRLESGLLDDWTLRHFPIHLRGTK
jgi:hypothetical protein